MKRSSRGDSSNRKIMAIDKRHSFHPQFHMNYKDLYVKSRLFFLHWSPNLASKLRTQNVLCIISVDHSKSNFHANHLWCEHCQGRKLGKPPWEILVAKVIGNWLLRLHISTLSHQRISSRRNILSILSRRHFRGRKPTSWRHYDHWNEFILAFSHQWNFWKF